MQLIVISGVSGSGKSIALNVLEDGGYYCVDNLPAQFIPDLARYLSSQGYTHLGIATDIRSRESLDQLPDTVRTLAGEHQVEVLFLTASTDALVQRYSETRRRHPLSIRTDGGVVSPGGEPAFNDTALMEAIEMERELLSPLARLSQAWRTGPTPSSCQRLIQLRKCRPKCSTRSMHATSHPSSANVVWPGRSPGSPCWTLCDARP